MGDRSHYSVQKILGSSVAPSRSLCIPSVHPELTEHLTLSDSWSEIWKLANPRPHYAVAQDVTSFRVWHSTDKLGFVQKNRFIEARNSHIWTSERASSQLDIECPNRNLISCLSLCLNNPIPPGFYVLAEALPLPQRIWLWTLIRKSFCSEISNLKPQYTCVKTQYK